MPTLLKPPVRVFISSPYTLGDTCANVRRQHDAFRALIDLGHAPFAPLLSHYQQLIHPIGWESWMSWCLQWVEQCQLVLRLPGESRGADIECVRARELFIPVLETRADILKYLVDDKEHRAHPLCALSDLLDEPAARKTEQQNAFSS